MISSLIWYVTNGFDIRWAVAGGLLGHVARCVFALHRNRLLAPERELVWTAFCAYAAGVLAVLLEPSGGMGLVNLIPFRTVWEAVCGVGFTRMVLWFDLLVFVPLGAFLPMLFQRVRTWPAVLGTAAGLAAAVELVQYFLGRSADIDDVLLRLVGCMAGYAVYQAVRRRWKGKKPVESRFMPGAN